MWGVTAVAIYSANLRSIGRTTHAAGTAGAHIRYIAREDAAEAILAHNMPEDAQAARTWMDGQERADRKNARVCDKLRIALPRELSDAENIALVRELMGDLGAEDVSWYAALHTAGKDALNPHVHIVIRDRHRRTGKRVLCLSDSARDREKKGLPSVKTGDGEVSFKAADWIRARWETVCNRALKRGGHEARIDRRSLRDQGVDREPTIHIGPRAIHIDSNVHQPRSKLVMTGTGRLIDYAQIDGGQTRRDHHDNIVAFNLEKAARSPEAKTRLWAQHERAQQVKDRAIEGEVKASVRVRTQEERQLKRGFAKDAARLREDGAKEARLARTFAKEKHAPALAALRAQHELERTELRDKQSRLSQRLLLWVDFTHRTRRRREAAWNALRASQRAEREKLVSNYQKTRNALQEAVRARYVPLRQEHERQRDRELGMLQGHHEDQKRAEERLLQLREAERERDRTALERQIEVFEAKHKSQRKAKTGNRHDRLAKRVAELEKQAKAKSTGVGRSRGRGRSRGGSDGPGLS